VPEAAGERLPDLIIRPRRRICVRRHLEVEAADALGPHGVQGETVGMPGVDQLIGRRRHVGEDSEPGKGIGPLPGPSDTGRDRLPARSERPVTAGNGVGVQPLFAAVDVDVGHVRPVAVQIVKGGVADLVDELLAHGIPGRDQIPGDLGLAVYPHAAANQVDEVEVMPLLGPLQVDPAVLEVLAPAAVRPGRKQRGCPP
jgi:hypothetical protein